MDKKERSTLIGTKQKSIEEIKKFFEDKFDLDFEIRESDYFGTYYQYSGFFADKVIILENQFCEYLHSDYDIVIQLIFVKGKKADRISKQRYFEKILSFRSDIKFDIFPPADAGVRNVVQPNTSTEETGG